jgi:hypothetical protein
VSWIARVLRATLALGAVVASIAGIAFYAVSGRQPWAWLAIGGLLALSVSLGWWLWSAQRSLRRIKSRRDVIDHLELLARVGRARLRLARLANDDAATLSERYAAWNSEVRKVIEERFGHDDLALFDGPLNGPTSGNVPGICSSWRDSLDRLVDLILRQG